MKIYDAHDVILGRLGSIVAKDALLVEEVVVVNCEKAVISGKKANTLAREHIKRKRKGYPLKSQTHSRLPDRFVRRCVRGMLPWKSARGREAYKLVMCYRGIPASFQGKELISLPQATVAKLPTLKYMTVGEICTQIGGKHDTREKM